MDVADDFLSLEGRRGLQPLDDILIEVVYRCAAISLDLEDVAPHAFEDECKDGLDQARVELCEQEV